MMIFHLFVSYFKRRKFWWKIAKMNPIFKNSQRKKGEKLNKTNSLVQEKYVVYKKS